MTGADMLALLQRQTPETLAAPLLFCPEPSDDSYAFAVLPVLGRCRVTGALVLVAEQQIVKTRSDINGSGDSEDITAAATATVAATTAAATTATEELQIEWPVFVDLDVEVNADASFDAPAAVPAQLLPSGARVELLNQDSDHNGTRRVEHYVFRVAGSIAQVEAAVVLFGYLMDLDEEEVGELRDKVCESFCQSAGVVLDRLAAAPLVSQC